jgi:hypothetical protein
MLIKKGIPETKIILEKFEGQNLIEVLEGAKIYFNKLIQEKSNFKDWEYTELENYFLSFINELINELE